MTTAGQPTFAAARDLARQVLDAALAAVEPGAAVRAVLRRDGERLLAGDHVYDLRAVRRIFVVGTGKAGEPMTQAVADALGDRLTAGAVTVKEDTLTSAAGTLDRVRFTEGGHPIPTQAAMDGAQRIVELAQSADEHDLVICLISGGGSALLPLPVEGVSLGRQTGDE